MWRSRATLDSGESNRSAWQLTHNLQLAKEVSDFNGGGFRSVGAVDDVVFDRGGELLANGSWSRVRGIGRAHHFPEPHDRVFSLQHHHNDASGTHECGEAVEKSLLTMDGVE